VSHQVQPEARESTRSAAERAADHAAIADSIDDLLPALIVKLGATGLAELEVRQDGLHIRLRRPTDTVAMRDRRAGDRSDRGERSSRATSGSSAVHPASLTAVGPGRDSRDAAHHQAGHRDPGHNAHRDDQRAVATSPAVGIYHPRSEARGGMKVRAGDRLGTVDMLGVPQEVVSPTDGLIGASLVEPGDAVEYGQELVVIEFASASAPTPPAAPPPPASSGSEPTSPPPTGPGR